MTKGKSMPPGLAGALTSALLLLVLQFLSIGFVLDDMGGNTRSPVRQLKMLAFFLGVLAFLISLPLGWGISRVVRAGLPPGDGPLYGRALLRGMFAGVIAFTLLLLASLAGNLAGDLGYSPLSTLVLRLDVFRAIDGQMLGMICAGYAGLAMLVGGCTGLMVEMAASRAGKGSDSPRPPQEGQATAS